MKILEKFRTSTKKIVAARSDLQTAIDELRAELFKLGQERDSVVAAPLSKEETVAKIKAHLDFLEKEASERFVAETFRVPDAKPNADSAFSVSTPPGGGGGAAGGFYPAISRLRNVGGLCLLGFREMIEASLLAHALAALPGDGIHDAERDASLRKIDADIEAIELAEEGLIRESEDIGVIVHRRENARPEIYLRETV